MELKLNETPVRTARNFNINNIKIKDVKLLEKIEKFENIEITGIDKNVDISKEVSSKKLIYGVSKELEKEANEKANHKLRLILKENSNIEIKYNFDEENQKLVDNIEIIANENIKANILIKYNSKEKFECYHNGIIRIKAKENSNLNIIFVNLLNTNTNNFVSIENELEDNSCINYTVVDFGGKHSVTNFYSNLKRENG